MSTRSNLEKSLENCKDVIKSFMVMLDEDDAIPAAEIAALHQKFLFPETTAEDRKQLRYDWNECLETTHLNHAHVDHDLGVFLKDCEMKRNFMATVFESKGFPSKAKQLEKVVADYENEKKDMNGECRKTIGLFTQRLHDQAVNLSECAAFLHEFGNEIQSNNLAFAKKMDEFILRKNALCAELFFSLDAIIKGVEKIDKETDNDPKIFLQWFKNYSSINFTEKT
jgi:hypothetical protein